MIVLYRAMAKYRHWLVAFLVLLSVGGLALVPEARSISFSLSQLVLATIGFLLFWILTLSWAFALATVFTVVMFAVLVGWGGSILFVGAYGDLFPAVWAATATGAALTVRASWVLLRETADGHPIEDLLMNLGREVGLLGLTVYIAFMWLFFVAFAVADLDLLPLMTFGLFTLVVGPLAFLFVFPLFISFEMLGEEQIARINRNLIRLQRLESFGAFALSGRSAYMVFGFALVFSVIGLFAARGGAEVDASGFVMVLLTTIGICVVISVAASTWRAGVVVLVPMIASGMMIFTFKSLAAQAGDAQTWPMIFPLVLSVPVYVVTFREIMGYRKAGSTLRAALYQSVVPVLYFALSYALILLLTVVPYGSVELQNGLLAGLVPLTILSVGFAGLAAPPLFVWLEKAIPRKETIKWKLDD